MNLFKIGQFELLREGEGAPAGGEAAHPVEAPWASSEGVWSLGEGEAATPWHATIPEAEARAHVEAKGYKNPAELALANYNLTKLQRGDPTVIGLPGENATADDMNAFYAKLGRPETADGYEFKAPEGVQIDDTMKSFAQTAFHAAGLTPAQAQTIFESWNGFVGEQNGALQQQLTEANTAELQALETKWGADFEKNRAAGERTMKALGLDSDLIERVEANIGSAAIVELLATIGRKSDEGGFTAGSQNTDPNDPSNMSKEQAQAKIAELQASAEFQAKFTDRNHPGHKEALSLMERLFAKA